MDLHHKVLIKNNRVYKHKLAHFYHTTYDIRRSEDIINPRTPHCNIMLLADCDPGPHTNDSGSQSLGREALHPFLYGRVIGIYHANIVYIGPLTPRISKIINKGLPGQYFKPPADGLFRLKGIIPEDEISNPPHKEIFNDEPVLRVGKRGLTTGLT